jgi:predicted RNase H-like HicB family nuclease
LKAFSFFSLPWLASFSFISSIGVKFLLKTVRKFEQEGDKKSGRKHYGNVSVIKMCYNILEVVIMKKYNFTILIEKDEDGMYVASVPALKGCHTQAKTVEELLPRIKEAIELCVECEKEDILQNEFIGVQQIEVVV